MRIAISTGGGDAPGLNAVIRSAVLSAVNRGWEVLGVKRGYAGLLGEDEVVFLTKESVRGIAHLGGTILRTTNRGSPFKYPVKQPDGSFIEVEDAAFMATDMDAKNGALAFRLNTDDLVVAGPDHPLRAAGDRSWAAHN